MSWSVVDSATVPKYHREENVIVFSRAETGPEEKGKCFFHAPEPGNVTAALLRDDVTKLLLPGRVASFYRWLHRWHAETNDLHACTGYYARKQKVSERTIYRWLAVLRSSGYVLTEQTIGVERRITPLLDAPPKRPQFHTKRQPVSRKMSGVCQGSVSGVSSLIGSDACKNATTATATTGAAGSQPPGVHQADKDAVASLRAAGLSNAVASRIVLSKGRKAALDALAALKAAKGVKNAAGWLIRAVEQNYRATPKEALEAPYKARTVPVVVPPVISSTGAQGYAAFAAMRERLTGRSGAVSDSGG